ncbi:MAG: hypothetical protein R3212_13425, partial [Xanthomonadales bacterium]|nr:hypothetical protein [Xanthomonadales bacterium]
WMIELFGVADRSFDDRGLSLHAGIDSKVAKGIHFLAAIGSQVARSSRAIEKLDHRVYVGLQWFF